MATEIKIVALPQIASQFINYERPLSDEEFIAIADTYSEWRAELQGDRTVVLMPGHGLRSRRSPPSSLRSYTTGTLL